jgi:hypothetical protein
MNHFKEFCKYMGALTFSAAAGAGMTLASLKFVDEFLFAKKK